MVLRVVGWVGGLDSASVVVSLRFGFGVGLVGGVCDLRLGFGFSWFLVSWTW